jgi:uncharacterized cupredoxin-like copper-binding protein
VEEKAMKSKVMVLVVLVIIASLALTACGPKKVSFDITLSDFKFDPNTWEVPAGAEVTLNLTNEGTQEHEWVLMVLGKDATIPFSEDDEGNIFWEHEVQPGESASVTFTAPTEPGEYHIVCGTAGHLEEGMRGTLTIK